MNFLLTTNPGIESIVREEIDEKIDADTSDFSKPGYVFVETDMSLEESMKNLRNVRSIHHILLYIEEGEIAELEDVCDMAKKIAFPHVEGNEMFRVTCDRHGTHDFGSMDVEREVGAIFNERYGLEVDLEEYDYNVYVNIMGDTCLFCRKCTTSAVSRRHDKVHHHSASVKTNIAYAMIRIANLSENDIVLDSFTGSGTIPLELHGLSETGLPLDIYASDRYDDAIEEARENFLKNNATIETKQCDARDLSSVYSETFDAIISNLPWGLKSGRRSDLYWMYRRFLESAESVLTRNGCIVVLVLKHGLFEEAMKKTSFTVDEKRVISTGTIRPRIIKIS